MLIVWKLDRLGRSLSHLIATLSDLQNHGVAFRSLSEEIDTTTAAGRMQMHLLGALAEFERELIVERTKAGLAAAKRRGIKPGPKGKLNDLQITDPRAQIEAGETVRHVARVLKVVPSTLYRALQASA